MIIPFIKYTKLYIAISTIIILTGLFYIYQYGFHISIDFTGGSNLQYSIKAKGRQINVDQIRKIFKNNKIKVIDLNIKNQKILIKSAPVNEKQEAKIRKNLKEKYGEIDLLLFETVGATIGQETIQKTIIALVVAIIGIITYIGFSFKGLNFSISAVLAMFHDILVILGMYAMLSYHFGAEFDSMFITALLTTMSFSVHDTIVIFDKIREYRRTQAKISIEEQTNKALTETMRRSINNSLTVIIMLVILLVLGGTTIKFFVAALLIGVITGTYSSPFVSAPFLVWLENRKKGKKNK